MKTKASVDHLIASGHIESVMYIVLPTFHLVHCDVCNCVQLIVDRFHRRISEVRRIVQDY